MEDAFEVASASASAGTATSTNTAEGGEDPSVQEGVIGKEVHEEVRFPCRFFFFLIYLTFCPCMR